MSVCACLTSQDASSKISLAQVWQIQTELLWHKLLWTRVSDEIGLLAFKSACLSACAVADLAQVPSSWNIWHLTSLGSFVFSWGLGEKWVNEWTKIRTCALLTKHLATESYPLHNIMITADLHGYTMHKSLLSLHSCGSYQQLVSIIWVLFLLTQLGGRGRIRSLEPAEEPHLESQTKVPREWMKAQVVPVCCHMQVPILIARDNHSDSHWPMRKMSIETSVQWESQFEFKAIVSTLARTS